MTECANCKYFEQRGMGAGLCRRHAPIHITLGDGEAIWPETSADDWCGDALSADSVEDKDDEPNE